MTKRVLIDVNILCKNKLEDLKKQKNFSLIGNKFKLYISEVVLKQRLVHLVQTEHKEDYDYYIDFIQKKCEKELIKSIGEIQEEEIKKNFQDVNIFGTMQVKHLCKLNDPNNKAESLDFNELQENKLNIRNEIRVFFNNQKKLIEEIENSKEPKTPEEKTKLFKNYCLEFINSEFEIKFDKAILHEFYRSQKKFNKDTCFNLLVLYWKYTILFAIFLKVGIKKADIYAQKMIKENSIPENSFLYYELAGMEYYIQNGFVKDQGYDPDAPNDLTYITLMKDFDILLTDDRKFMRRCFNSIYSNTSKQILSFKEFEELLNSEDNNET